MLTVLKNPLGWGQNSFIPAYHKRQLRMLASERASGHLALLHNKNHGFVIDSASDKSMNRSTPENRENSQDKKFVLVHNANKSPLWS